jgi:hypothetical protein
MRRLTAVLLLALACWGCKRRATADDAPAELPADLLSSFAVADPRAAVQLTRGFYGLEGNSWRWTAGAFGVVLAPPQGARERGATLELKLSIPDVIFQKLGPMTLRASFHGEALMPETFAAAGEHVYKREIPPSMFGDGAVSIEFTTDRSLPPGEADTRELALVVTAVGLEPR